MSKSWSYSSTSLEYFKVLNQETSVQLNRNRLMSLMLLLFSLNHWPQFMRAFTKLRNRSLKFDLLVQLETKDAAHTPPLLPPAPICTSRYCLCGFLWLKCRSQSARSCHPTLRLPLRSQRKWRVETEVVSGGVSKPPTCHVCIISTLPTPFASVHLVAPKRGLRQKGRTYGPL